MNRQRQIYERIASNSKWLFMEGFNAAIEYMRGTEQEFGQIDSAPELFKQWLADTEPVELCTCKHCVYWRLRKREVKRNY